MITHIQLPIDMLDKEKRMTSSCSISFCVTNKSFSIYDQFRRLSFRLGRLFKQVRSVQFCSDVTLRRAVLIKIDISLLTTYVIRSKI